MGRVRVWASLGAVAAATLVAAAPATAAPDVGAITGVGCISDVGVMAGCGASTQGLQLTSAVTTSPDGRSVYAISNSDDAIVRFDRSSTGALTPAGCISDVSDPAGCGTTQQGLDSASDVAVSPDGRSVYVAAQFDNAIVRFDRNTTTGALTPAGCITDVGIAGCAATQQGLGGAQEVDVSPDGKSVYVASDNDDAIVRFNRNTSTGALTGAGCIADVGDAAGCGNTQQGLSSATSVAVSPDGKSVYAAGLFDNTIVRFDRNTSNGALIPAGCIADVGDSPGCGATQQGLNAPTSVIVTSDGKSVYATSAADDAIVRFDRNTTTGALAGAGCISDVGDPGSCGTTQQGLDQPFQVEASLDGKSIYVPSSGDDAVVRFDRNTTSGALTPAGCVADVGGAAGCGATQQGLDNAAGVNVSPDGRSVYVAAQFDNAIVRFDRVPDASNHTPLSIPVGAGDPNPSTIQVLGLDAKTSDVNVKLEGFGHGFPPDVDVLVEGPAGQRVMLMSDAGGFNPVGDLDLTFDDSAPQQLLGTPTTGSYRPTNVDNGVDPFATPYCNPGPSAPSPVADCLTQAFRGTNPNGTWKLYVSDTDPGSDGGLSRGWSLDITTDVAPPETTIDSGPSGTITDANPSFAFSSSEAGSTFECSLDNGAFAPCSSPKVFLGIALGPHNFAVRAIDPTGNLDASPATRLFAVAAPSIPDDGCDAAKSALDKANAALAKAKKALKKAKASKNKAKIKKAKAKAKKAKAKVKSAQADVDAAC